MRFAFLTLIFIGFFSCNTKGRFNNAKFDKLISKLEVHPDTLLFDEMNKLKERSNIFDTELVFKTSTVNYCRIYDSEGGFSCSDNYQCHVFFYQSDTLRINIGNFNGYGGDGFEIRYINGKFYTQPYRETHIDPPDKPEAKVEIKQQLLILDKEDYKPGDSLYGKIYFHAIVSEFGRKSEHFAQGYFRAKVAER